MIIKIIKKSVFAVLLLCGTQALVHAQQDGFGWRVGGSVGYMGYHGDLSSNNLLKEVRPTRYLGYLRRAKNIA